MATYCLSSNRMIFTPGMVKIARMTAKTDGDFWVVFFVDGYGLPEAAARDLINGIVPYQVEGDLVVFEHTSMYDMITEGNA